MSSVFVFKDFELDAFRFELRRAGQRIGVQPKVLRLLFHLVTHRERSVSNRELLEVLWPNERVTPASVRRAVAGARRALGEPGTSQLSIRTVRDHGYQFTLPVRESRATSEPPVADDPALTDAPASTATARAAPRSDTSYVGRAPVLALIDATLAEVLRGEARGLLVTGAEGLGKTRTLQELVARARVLGVNPWWARCNSRENPPALWPVLHILRDAAAELLPAGLSTLMGPGAADIVEALPELQPWLPEASGAPRIDPLSARFRFADSMALFLRRAAQSAPRLLVFDDLHAADSSTLSLIAFLMRQLEGAPVLIAAGLRPVADTNPQRLELRRAIANEPSARHVELTGLTHEELTAWLRLRSARDVPEAIISQLHAHTSGNPLLLEHVLQSVAALDPCEEAAWSRLGEAAKSGARAAVARQLAGLDEACARALRAAAVIGCEFSLATLANVLETTADHALALLTDALSQGALSATDSVGRYRFTHALLREVLYEESAPPERARLHGKVGAALEASGAVQTTLAELTEHFVRAAPTHDGGRALTYALRAAHAAMQRLAHEEAIQYLDRAQALAELGGASDLERLEVLLEQGDALLGAGDTSRARDTLLAAGGLADRIGSTAELVRAVTLLGRLSQSGSVDTEHVQLLERALASLSDDDERKARVQALLAKALIWSREHRPRAERARRALVSAERLHDRRERTEALLACLPALADPDCLEERLRITAELEREGHEQGDHRALLAAAAARVWSSVELGDMVSAESSIGALETLAEQLRDPYARWQAQVFRTMRTLIAGRLSAAASLARDTLTLGTRLGEPAAARVFCTHYGGILRLQDRLDEAAALVRDVALRHPAIAGWQAVLAVIEAELGRKQQARRVLERLLERDLESLRCDPFMLGALAPAAELCALVGDTAHARCLYDALLPYEDRQAVISNGTNTHGPVARHLGRLAMRLHDARAADSHFVRAIAASEAMPSPIFSSVSYLHYAHLLVASGGSEARERARDLVERAFEIAHTTGLRAVTAHCRTLAERAKLPLRMPQPRSA